MKSIADRFSNWIGSLSTIQWIVVNVIWWGFNLILVVAGYGAISLILVAALILLLLITKGYLI